MPTTKGTAGHGLTVSAPPMIPMSHTALLLIDLQRGLREGFNSALSNPKLALNVARLLAGFRACMVQESGQDPTSSNTKWPLIIHVMHESVYPSSPLHPSSNGCEFEDFAMPGYGELVFKKNVNCAFTGVPDLEKLLRSRNIQRLVVGGTTTDHCVSTSVRTAADRGVVDRGNILLVDDATAARGKPPFDGETVQAVHLASLDGEFCAVVSTDSVLTQMNEWL